MIIVLRMRRFAWFRVKWLKATGQWNVGRWPS